MRWTSACERPGRHPAVVKLYYTDHFVLPLPEGHRFPMSKYAELRRRLERASWTQASQFRVPEAATDEEILRAHDAGYLERVATLNACRAALDDGIAVNLAGGTHHAFRDRGEGFCVFNDSVIAARAMQSESGVRRVLVIDCDVHQGNGTAAICVDDPSIYTFSIHGARNFPFRKERSDLDVALEDGTDDETYLQALAGGLARALDEASPDLAVYLSGADPWRGDRWGRLGLTKRGLAERDRFVLATCRERGLPVVVTMAGGYAPRVEDTVDIHVRTVRTACELHGAV